MQVVSTLPPVTGEKYAALTTLLCASSASCAGCAVPGLRPAMAIIFHGSGFMTMLCASSASCAGCAVPGMRPAKPIKGLNLVLMLCAIFASCAGCAVPGFRPAPERHSVVLNTQTTGFHATNP